MADETVLKIDGRNTWFWDIIDTKTRYLLASRLFTTRTTKDARALVEKASEKDGKTPKTIITDKLASYIDGIELAFGSDTKHIVAKTLTSEQEKQYIERFHGTLKARTKIMRGLKSRETAQDFLDGWLIHYNYLRPHESLADSTGNHTPAEKADIKFNYKTWLDVVKDSAQPYIASKPKPNLGLHHPPIVKSATATLGHFAGHKIRLSSPTPKKCLHKYRGHERQEGITILRMW